MNECTCPLGADECTGDTGIFHPLQDGGMCATRPCQGARPASDADHAVYDAMANNYFRSRQETPR
jgi:hypothetical protein